MEVVIVADNKVDDMSRGAILKASEFGYNVTICEPDKVPDKLSNGQTIGDVTYTPKSSFKPYTLRNIYEYQSSPFVYMDADTLIIKPFDIDWDFDIGVTMKRESEKNYDNFTHISGHLNAGVIFINKSKGAKKFLDLWCQEMPKTKSGSDQEALTNLVLNPLEDIKIKHFTTDEYNFYYFNEPIPPKTKVLHFKGGYRKLWKTYANVNN